MKRVRLSFLILLFIVFLFSDAMATYMADITYDYANHGGGNYTFNFKVYNTSTGADTGGLDFFLINFDADADDSLYSNLAWTADNGWFTGAFEYDPGFGGLPALVFADDSIFGSGGGGIAQGSSLGGFKVNFDYSGALLPGDQLFSWHTEFGTNLDGNGLPIGEDPTNPDYWIMGSADGATRYVSSDGGGTDVPEPSTMLLLGSGLVGVYAMRRKIWH